MEESPVAEVERWLGLLYIEAEGAALRKEDRRKALEVSAMLAEIDRAVCRFSSRSPWCSSMRLRANRMSGFWQPNSSSSAGDGRLSSWPSNRISGGWS